ncbi:MAG: hypothetical protein O2990_00075 [Bacteroidetes bacterium]|nr:hypothetical protein [Bacteroidota bacterium]
MIAFARPLAFSLFLASVFAVAQQPWHHPNEFSLNEDFIQFAQACTRDSSWVEARVLLDINGASKEVIAARDADSGKIYFHSNGDMRWVVEGGMLDSNLSVSLVEGYNGGSESLVWQDQLHSLGGYGLWRKHFDLLRFEGGKQAWQLLGVVGDKPQDRDVDRSIAHARGGSYFVLEEMMEQGVYGNSEYILRELDVASREWSVKGIVDPRLGSLNGGFGMGDHWVLRNYAGELIVVTLDDMVAYVFPNRLKELNSFLSWNPKPGRRTFVQPDSAWHVYNGLRKSFVLPQIGPGFGSQFNVVDASQPIRPKAANSSFDARESNQGGGQSMQPRATWLPWSLVAVLSLFLLRLLTKRRQKDDEVSQSQDESVASRISPMTEKLMKEGGKQLETEELDELLGISHLSSPETLRSQRARSINRINTEYRILHGADLIVRRQSQEDRRRSVYVIHSFE